MFRCIKGDDIPSGQIILTHTNEKTVYLSDETLSGQVVLQTNQTISTENLCLSFVGNLHKTYNNQFVPVRSMPMPHTIDEIFYRQEIDLSLPSGANVSLVSNHT